jgi:hypothetical protein
VDLEELWTVMVRIVNGDIVEEVYTLFAFISLDPSPYFGKIDWGFINWPRKNKLDM